MARILLSLLSIALLLAASVNAQFNFFEQMFQQGGQQRQEPQNAASDPAWYQENYDKGSSLHLCLRRRQLTIAMQHTVINTSVPTHWLAYRSQRIALARTQTLKIKSSWVMEKCVSLREDSKLGRLRGKWNWLGKDCYDPGSVEISLYDHDVKYGVRNGHSS